MFRAAGFDRVQTRQSVARASVLLLTVLAMGGCSSLGEEMPDLFASKATPEPQQVADASGSAGPQDELQKATVYWGKEYQTKPSSLEAGLSYARNLKAMGQKGQAMAVLQQASMYHPTDKKLNSEYGRLALEFDQVSLAEKLLAIADDPTAPDWRVVSARGTVKAKQGKYAEAIPFYERALSLSKDQPSVLNNLALAHAMGGDATKAEELLRTAAAANGADPKTRQNLALVLGLQGKYDEATRTGTAGLSSAVAAENTALVRQIVKLEPKTGSQGGTVAASTALASASGAPGLKPSATDTSAAASGWNAKVASAAAPAAAAATAPLPWTKPAAQAPANPASPVSEGGPGFKPSAN